jgi:hypothetical protein
MHARFDRGGSNWSLWETSGGSDQGQIWCQGDIAFIKRVLPTKLGFQYSPFEVTRSLPPATSQVDGLRKLHRVSVCACLNLDAPCALIVIFRPAG